MPVIEVDFETWREITSRRAREDVTEGDVIRNLLGLDADKHLPGEFWVSEGVKFPVGTLLEHRFRDGRRATAIVRAEGVEVEGRTYSGLSAAGTAITGHNLNGWRFWFVRDENGALSIADSLRSK